MFSTLKVDAVLIFRGGGSQAELSVFNDYDVARAVCLCPHPVLAAIGHQEDRSSVQDVSFRELGVPKDIGRFFADIISNYRRAVAEAKKALLAYGEGRVEHLLRSVEVFSNAFLGLLRKHIESTEEKLTRLQKAIPLAGEQALTQTGRRFLERAQPLAALAVAAFRQEVLRFRGLASIGREISQFVEKMEMRLENFAKIFETADPAAQLRRGFAIVRSSPSGDIVTQGAALTKGMEIEIEFQDIRRLAETK